LPRAFSHRENERKRKLHCNEKRLHPLEDLLIGLKSNRKDEQCGECRKCPSVEDRWTICGIVAHRDICLDEVALPERRAKEGQYSQGHGKGDIVKKVE
jgi:hypothetical protein